MKQRRAHSCCAAAVALSHMKPSLNLMVQQLQVLANHQVPPSPPPGLAFGVGLYQHLVARFGVLCDAGSTVGAQAVGALPGDGLQLGPVTSRHLAARRVCALLTQAEAEGNNAGQRVNSS